VGLSALGAIINSKPRLEENVDLSCFLTIVYTHIVVSNIFSIKNVLKHEYEQNLCMCFVLSKKMFIKKLHSILT